METRNDYWEKCEKGHYITRAQAANDSCGTCSALAEGTSGSTSIPFLMWLASADPDIRLLVGDPSLAGHKDAAAYAKAVYVGWAGAIHTAVRLVEDHTARDTDDVPVLEEIAVALRSLDVVPPGKKSESGD